MRARVRVRVPPPWRWQVSFTVLLSRYIGAFSELEAEERLVGKDERPGGAQVGTRRVYRGAGPQQGEARLPFSASIRERRRRGDFQREEGEAKRGGWALLGLGRRLEVCAGGSPLFRWGLCLAWPAY